MKGVKKMINILVRIISITIMKLLVLPKAKKPDHFACKMGLQTSINYKPSAYLVIAYCLTFPPMYETYFLPNWLPRSNQK
jgi:hypothetical protein